MTRSRTAVGLMAAAACIFWTDSFTVHGFPSPVPVSMARAQDQPSSSAQIMFRFQNAELREALPEFGRLLGIGSIFVESGVTGTLTGETSAPISREDGFEVLLKVLSNNKAVLVRSLESIHGYRVIPVSRSLPAGYEPVATIPPPLPGPAPATATGISSPRGEPLRVTGNLQEMKLIHKVEPVGTELAVRARVSGVVLAEVLVNEQGEVASVRFYRCHPLLCQPAMEAIRQWRYAPTYANGAPVPVITTVRLAFDSRQS